MKRFTFFMSLLGIVVIVLTSILPAIAQDVVGECAPEELAASISDRLAEAPGDREALTDMLRSIAGEIAANDAACSGLSFEGNAPAVVGPVDIPEGIYRVTVTTGDLFIMGMLPLEGTCGSRAETDDESNIFILAEAQTGADALVYSEGCSALLDVESAIDPWALTFEKVR